MGSAFRPDASLSTSDWSTTVDVQAIMPGAQVTITVERELTKPEYKVRVQARYGTEDLVSYSVMWAGLDRDQQESFIEDRARTALKHLAGVVTGKWDPSLRPTPVPGDELARVRQVLDMYQARLVDSVTALRMLQVNPTTVIPVPIRGTVQGPAQQTAPVTPALWPAAVTSPWHPGQAAILAMGAKTVGRARLWVAEYAEEEIPAALTEHTRFVEKVRERLS